MKAWLKAPSKTFLAGEYAVLSGEPGLILCTEPQFKMSFEKDTDATKGFSGIHPDSPAGRLMRQNASLFREWSGEFEDPHEGAGGFGASSAQFLFVTALKAWAEAGFESSIPEMNPMQILDSYLALHKSHAILPSGTDVVAQAIGGITHIDRNQKITRSLKWNFKDLDFLIVKTRLKVNTHNALQTVAQTQLSWARDIVEDIVQSIETKDSDFLISNINEYQQWLSSNELVHDNTREILLQFLNTEVKAAKGCGALGADTMLLFFHPDDKEKVLHRLPGLQLQPISGSKDLADGLHATVDRDFVGAVQ